MISRVIFISLFLLFSVNLFSNENLEDLLTNIIDNYEYESEISFKFERKHNYLTHGFRPFSLNSNIINGTCLLTKDFDLYINSNLVIREDQSIRSLIMYSKDFFFDHNLDQDKVIKKTKKEYTDFFYVTLLFTPMYAFSELIFYHQKDDFNSVVFNDSTINFPRLNGDTITISIDDNFVISDIIIKYDNELYGDVEKKYSYRAYDTTDNGKLYPKRISQSQLNYIENFIEISLNEERFDEKEIIDLIPSDYKLTEHRSDPIKLKHVKQTENIHFFEIEATDDRVMIVNFNEYLLAAEAPLNTENGQKIIEKAKEIFPNKPIKYFVFGHHHPHYIGGIRAFVNEGSTILAHSSNDDYVEFLVNAKHEINKDVLSSSKKELNMQLIDSTLEIGDEDFKMEIIHIGSKSKHTADYLIYYFPSEKLVFQDDLVWIKEDGSSKKASDRQKGLYKAIKFNKLDVETIIQSWPVKDYGVKTIISFEELENNIR